MKVKIEQMRLLLEDLPRDSSVSITKPEELARSCSPSRLRHLVRKANVSRALRVV
jgi:acetylglutamate synthase